MEAERNADFEQLGRKYSSIGPLITKLQAEIVGEKDIDPTEKFQPFYDFWEKRIFNRVYNVII